MNRSVAYQETANDFTDIRQTIKGAQIPTIKNFGLAPPAGGGDFVGQFGVAGDAQGNSLLYIYGVGGNWKLVGSSGKADIPDTVVEEDKKNNFTEVDQRIEDCPIMYMESGTRNPNSVPIKGEGHVYVYESNPIEVFISYDGGTWTSIMTQSMGDVELGKPNNFTNPKQEIEGSPIVNMRKSSIDPKLAGITPLREGEIYIQIAEGTADRKARLWVANKPTTTTWEWEPLTHIFELPATVAQTSKSNNFQSTDQRIAGNQIMSFIDGGGLNPGDSGAKPDYDGQFYLATKQNSLGYQDVAIWVARGNQWLPIQENIDLATIVRNNISNRFSNPEQILGEGGPNARWLIGARHKFSGASPIADSKWRVQNIGEITIYENSTTIPREISIWMGVSKNPSTVTNQGEWAMVWSNATGRVDKIAYTDFNNEFVPLQYINNGGKKSLINTGHEGGAASPKNTIVPVAPGDTYTQSYSHPGYGETRNIWMAAIEADTTSWKRVLAADDKDVVLADKQNNFLSRDQFLGKDTDTKRDRIMGSRKNHIGGPAYNGVAPTMFGEVVVCEEWDPAYPSDVDKKVCVAYLAVGTSRKSWLEIGRRLIKDLDMIDDGTNN